MNLWKKAFSLSISTTLMWGVWENKSFVGLNQKWTINFYPAEQQTQLRVMVKKRLWKMGICSLHLSRWRAAGHESARVLRVHLLKFIKLNANINVEP